jgi:gliding motility associated protien GldN
MKKLTYIICLLVSVNISAQLPGSGVSLQSNVLDGVYIQEHIPTKRVVQYTHLREADVMWAKRVWRVIDLTEKMNHKLYYPLTPLTDRMCLFEVIKYGALEEGAITVYTPEDDRFTFPVKPSNGNINDPEFKYELNKMFSREIKLKQRDPNTGEVMTDAEGNDLVKDTIEFYESRDIRKYEIKEDWFFDKQRSVLDVRIIGISPIVYMTEENTDTGLDEIVGLKNIFWLYFPECRYTFQNFYVYNPSNDSQKMSFDDLFWKREFSSFIKKESNVFDRKIAPNNTGLNALLESERIKQEMFTFEHDLWHF